MKEMKKQNLITQEIKEKFNNDVIRLYGLIGGTRVYDELLKVADIPNEALDEKYPNARSFAQALNFTEEMAKYALAGAFIYSFDYVKGTELENEIFKITGVSEETIENNYSAFSENYNSNENEDDEDLEL